MLHGDQEDGVDITANSLHPGAIATNIHRYNSVLTGNCRIVLLKRKQCLYVTLNR